MSAFSRFNCNKLYHSCADYIKTWRTRSTL